MTDALCVCTAWAGLKSALELPHQQREQLLDSSLHQLCGAIDCSMQCAPLNLQHPGEWESLCSDWLLCALQLPSKWLALVPRRGEKDKYGSSFLSQARNYKRAIEGGMDEYLLGPQFSFLSLLSENGDILLPLTGSTYEKNLIIVCQQNALPYPGLNNWKL